MMHNHLLRCKNPLVNLTIPLMKNKTRTILNINMTVLNLDNISLLFYIKRQDKNCCVFKQNWAFQGNIKVLFDQWEIFYLSWNEIFHLIFELFNFPYKRVFHHFFFSILPELLNEKCQFEKAFNCENVKMKLFGISEINISDKKCQHEMFWHFEKCLPFFYLKLNQN